MLDNNNFHTWHNKQTHMISAPFGVQINAGGAARLTSPLPGDRILRISADIWAARPPTALFPRIFGWPCAQDGGCAPLIGGRDPRTDQWNLPNGSPLREGFEQSGGGGKAARSGLASISTDYPFNIITIVMLIVIEVVYLLFIYFCNYG